MYIKINPEVQNAIKNGIGVVALESTIISHGMPYPENVETALKAEKVIRDNGCIPATIAIIKGVPTVGLSKDEIDYLGREGTKVAKVSTRDIPFIVSKSLTPTMISLLLHTGQPFPLFLEAISAFHE